MKKPWVISASSTCAPAGAVSGGDAEKRELQLFSSLTEVAPNELEGLKVVDYNRVQEGYFRLVDESEL